MHALSEPLNHHINPITNNRRGSNGNKYQSPKKKKPNHKADNNLNLNKDEFTLSAQLSQYEDDNTTQSSWQKVETFISALVSKIDIVKIQYTIHNNDDL